MSSLKASPLCPSASSSAQDTVIFGIVTHSGSSAKIGYLEEPIKFEPLQWSEATSVDSAQVFRLAGRCLRTHCSHFSSDSERCTLADRIVDHLNPVAEALPPCSIRRHCVWWQQHGKGACIRCPQVVTRIPAPSDAELAVVRAA